jgi:hypothetical protein
VNMMGMAAPTCSRDFDPAQSYEKKDAQEGYRNRTKFSDRHRLPYWLLIATVAPPSLILSSAPATK